MEKTEWVKNITRPLSPLKVCTLFKGLSDLGLENSLILPAIDKNDWYFNRKQYDRFVKDFIQSLGEEDFVSRLIDRCYSECEDMVKTTEAIRMTKLAEKSSKELRDLWELFHEKLSRWPYYWITAIEFDKYVTGVVRQALKETLESQGRDELLEEYFTVLTTKIKPIFAEEEEEELLEIRAKYEKKSRRVDAELKKLLREHTEKYAWLPTYDFDLMPWEETRFFERMEELSEEAEKELKERREGRERAKERITEVISDIKPRGVLKSLLGPLQEFLYLRTYRTDILRILYYNMQPFLGEIARRANWEANEIAYFTYAEVLDFLGTGGLPPREETRERQKHYAIVKKGGISKLFFAEKEIENIVRTELAATREKVDILRGTGIYPGIVRAPVKIVETIKSAYKMEKGDILVASMTTPDMHSIIEKASAIITDEGGITSHAALVSRELQIPCVLGTEIATQVLKDGYLVEVNSREGLVKVIERKGDDMPMKREKVTFVSEGYELVGIKEIPEKVPTPGVILCHGFTNSKEDCPLINETAEMLLKEGFITFRFDFFGSGESPGLLKDKRISILEQNLKDCLDYFAQDERVESIGLWGRSLGGTMVALCASDPRVFASVFASGISIAMQVFDMGVFKMS